jgi:hypothetical protein
MATVVIRPSSRQGVDCDAEIVLATHDLLEAGVNWVVGLGAVVLGQVIALRLGEARGRPIDTAPGLSKVTLSA